MFRFSMHFHDFKYDLINTCVSYLLYSPARPSCLILFCLVPDIEPAVAEAEHAVETVERPLEREWNLSLDDIFWE